MTDIISRQTIIDYGDAVSEHSDWSVMATEDYMGLKEDVTRLIQFINNGDFSPQSGSGSPEGSVEANYSKLYVDTDVNQLYFNESVGASTGWVTL